MPVSATEISTPRRSAPSTSTRPPSGVSCPRTGDSASPVILRSSRRFPHPKIHLELQVDAFARPARAAPGCPASPGAGRSEPLGLIRPASTLEERMSLMSEVAAGGKDILECSSCLGFSSRTCAAAAPPEPDDGVQRGAQPSCDMLAGNSDLCWLATSGSRLFSSISRKGFALAMYLRLVGERLHETHDALAERPGGAPHHHDAARRRRRRPSARSAPSRPSRRRGSGRIAVGLLHVGICRLPGLGGLADRP